MNSAPDQPRFQDALPKIGLVLPQPFVVIQSIAFGSRQIGQTPSSTRQSIRLQCDEQFPQIGPAVVFQHQAICKQTKSSRARPQCGSVARNTQTCVQNARLWKSHPLAVCHRSVIGGPSTRRKNTRFTSPKRPQRDRAAEVIFRHPLPYRCDWLQQTS